MPPAIPEYRLQPVNRVALTLVDGSWPFAEAKRQEIAEHWAQMTAQNPTLFNGNILLMVRGGLADGLFQADLIEVDYASFITWRDWGWCDETVHDCYGSAIVVSCDGALVMGRMGGHTVNAGKVYPPGGSLTREDLLCPEGLWILQPPSPGSWMRKPALMRLKPRPAAFTWPPLTNALPSAKSCALPTDAEALAARTNAHIAAEELPELSEAVIIRRMDELDPDMMPPHARAFASAVLENAPVAR